MGRASIWAAAAALGIWGCGDGQNVVALAGTATCSACHSGPGDPPPFHAPGGLTNPNQLPVGAHTPHLNGGLTSNITCADCHIVPSVVNQPGHLDAAPPSDIVFGTLARTGGANPQYVATGCAATYCHGNFPGGNTSNAPKWLGGIAAGACGTCHGLPPATGQHVFHVGIGIGCEQCHGPLARATHVNGVVNVTLPGQPATGTCAQACHNPLGSW
jgi:predicted CxxxxCH...CXXCH cytochrome family protein